MFNDEEFKRIFEFAKGKTRTELYRFVQEELKRTDVTELQIKRYTNNHPDLWEIMGREDTRTLLTVEQSNFAYQFAPGRSNYSLMKALNKEFGLDLTIDQVCGWTKRRPDIRRQMTPRVKEKGEDVAKLMRPSHVARRHPIGSVRETRDGAMVKMIDCNDQYLAWKTRTKIVWENAHGYTDKDIAHLDGNVFNDSLDNLCPISRSARGYMTGHKLWVYDDPELTKARIAMAEVKVQSSKLENKNNESI